MKAKIANFFKRMNETFSTVLYFRIEKGKKSKMAISPDYTYSHKNASISKMCDEHFIKCSEGAESRRDASRCGMPETLKTCRTPSLREGWFLNVIFTDDYHGQSIPEKIPIDQLGRPVTPQASST